MELSEGLRRGRRVLAGQTRKCPKGSETAFGHAAQLQETNTAFKALDIREQDSALVLVVFLDDLVLQLGDLAVDPVDLVCQPIPGPTAVIGQLQARHLRRRTDR